MSEQAGREMDARVAEKVMGTPKYWSVWFACSHYGNFNGLDQAQVYAEKIQGDFKAHVIPYSDEPAYSTSIAAAWEVVTKMSPDWGIDMCNWGTEWNVSFHERNNSANYHYVVHPSLPMAIALAALKAVGAEGEGR